MDEWICEDVGLFWDFGSLHQPPRVQDEEELFKQGLQASNRWYGSTCSSVLPGSQLTCRGRLSRCNSFSFAMQIWIVLASLCAVKAP